MRLKILIGMILMIAVLVIAGCSQKDAQETQGTDASIGVSSDTADTSASTQTDTATITVFKSESCGCCSVYVKYLDTNDYTADVQQVDDMDSVKSELKIPQLLRSCHTVKVGNYFVEGHVPIEAIEKLLNEKPDILGIALPGMPSGSPGMPGSKTETWTIYAVKNDGSYEEFMKI